MGGRFMETGNAWDPAEESVAQSTFEKESGVFKMMLQPGPGSVRNHSGCGARALRSGQRSA